MERDGLPPVGGGGGGGERPLVLLIVPDPGLREELRQAFEAGGCDVLPAASGERGLQLAEGIRPDLFLIDARLPGLPGTAVVQRIRMDQALRRLPCMLLADPASSAGELEALEAGADACAFPSDGASMILARASALMRAKPAPAALEAGRRADRVLLIDADRPGRAALAAELAAEGYDLVEAGSAAAALALLETEQLDAILLDARIPDMGANAACLAIKGRPGSRDLPLLLLGGTDDPDAMRAGLGACADDYLPKTKDGPVLKARLRAHLRRKRFEDENRAVRAALMDEILAKGRAEAGTQAKTDFLAAMSHEIRTPMNAVLGTADLLARTGLDDEQRGYVELLRRAGEGLLAIVDDVLDLSKIEAGRLELEAAPFKLHDVVQRVVGLAAVAGEEKGLLVEASVAPGTPEALIGDAHRFGQVLTNLLGNAVKFTARGRVALTIGPDPDDPRPGALRIAVSDTGPGIPADQLEAIFEPFQQAEAGTTRRYGGTGLGLAIVRRLVGLMGGRIRAQSAPGLGAAFTFTAQFGLAEAPAPAPAPVQDPGASAERPLAILIAEDLPDNRAVFEAYFIGTPHACSWAVDGADVVAQYREGAFDLVLMDMQMPIMDGYDATRAIRAFEREQGRPRTPVLALTASVMRHEVARCLSAGCDGHLPKPLRRRELLEAVAGYS